MLSTKTDFLFDVLSRAQQIAYDLRASRAGYLDDQYNSPAGRNASRFRPGSPENIDSGSSGILLFIIEVYRATGKEEFLQQARDLSEHLFFYCKETPSDDYTLFMGRSGLIYCLIRLYSLTKDKELLDRSLSLFESFDAETSGSEINSDDLYGGRAGVLLCLLNLFKITGESSIYTKLCEVLRQINQHAIWSREGISWENNAGIAYVLRELAACFESSGLNFLIRQSEKYLDQTAPSAGGCSNLYSAVTATLTNSKPSYELHQIEDSLAEYLYDKDHLSDTRLMHGGLGFFYCALNHINPKEDQEYTREKLTLPGTEAEIKKQLLSRHFFRTIKLLETASPFVSEILTGDENDHYPDGPMSAFESHVQNEVIRIEGSPIHDYLEDVFILECQIAHFAQAGDGNNGTPYLDDYSIKESAVRHLNCTNEEMEQLTLVQSEKMKTIISKWDWSLKDRDQKSFTPLANIHVKPGAYPLIVYRHNDVGVRE